MTGLRPTTATVIGLLASTLAICAITGSAEASVKSTGMRDGRYCEIFTVYLSPSPVARINNTFGLNNCRQGWWDSLDTAALAAEHDADLALLNGPRNWLMDRVTVSDPGPIGEFAGKQLREVASIDLTKIGLAPQPPFKEVKITRGTKFVFQHGRRVFQLIDPNGRIYVMQSYSQIVDPDLSYDQLRGLRSRMGLPEGWNYRSVKLGEENLTLRANGQATIIQDELKNTYQRISKSYSE